MNIKIRKLACLTGVILAYFNIFLFGQITFVAQSTITIPISITGKSALAEVGIRLKNTNPSGKAKFDDNIKILGYGILLFKNPKSQNRSMSGENLKK
jgi:hypothetical protein